jgi:hypothetical protein
MFDAPPPPKFFRPAFIVQGSDARLQELNQLLLGFVLCVLSGRSRADEPADIGGGWFLSGRHPKAGMMPVRSSAR